MAVIFLKKFSIVFSWMKMYEFHFTEVSSQGSKKNISALVQTLGWRQAILWNNDGLFSDAYMRHWPQWVIHQTAFRQVTVACFQKPPNICEYLDCLTNIFFSFYMETHTFNFKTPVHFRLNGRRPLWRPFFLNHKPVVLGRIDLRHICHSGLLGLQSLISISEMAHI